MSDPGSRPRDDQALSRLDAALAAADLVERVVVFERSPGERPWAVVVPDDAAIRAARIVNVHEALRFRIENAAIPLPPADRPLGVTVARASLPRTPDRRIDRPRLRREIGDPPARFWPPAPPSDRPLPQAWQELLAGLPELAEYRGPWTKGISLEADLGLDSLDRLALLVGLAQTLGVEMPEDNGTGVFTLGDLVEAFGERPPVALPELATRRRAVLGFDRKAPRRHSVPERLAWPVARWVLRPAVRPVIERRFSPRPRGLEQVDWDRRPLLIAQSHQSHWDALLLLAVIDPAIHRQIHFLGYSGYFARRGGWVLGRLFGISPIDADTYALPGLRAGRRALEAGRIVVIYPEGERTWTGALQRFRRGVAWLAATTGAAVVPSAITGAYRAAPRGWPSCAHPVTVGFGPPLDPPASLDGVEERRFLTELRARVAAMVRDQGEDPEQGDPQTWACGPVVARKAV